MFIKRLTISLSGLALAGILFLSCESLSSLPPFLSVPLKNNQIVLLSAAAAPLATVSLDSLPKMLIVEGDAATTLGVPPSVLGYKPADIITDLPSVFVPMDELHKIIFQ